MRKGLIYLGIFLFLLPLAFAGIDLDDFVRTRYNLGENINLRGSLSLNESVEGRLNVDVECNNLSSTPVYFTLFYVDIKDIYDFSVDVPLKESYLGICHFVVSVEWSGNSMKSISNDFEVTDELDVDVISNSLMANAGDNIVISGSAYNLKGDPIRIGRNSITIDGDTRFVELKNGVFQDNWGLLKNTATGKHEVVFNVQDMNGNKGRDVASFKIIATQSNLAINADESYLPGSSVNGKVILYDQAGDEIIKKLVLELYSPSGNIENSLEVTTSSDFEILLDEFAVPGIWKLYLKSDNLEANRNFVVEEVKSKFVWMEGNKLFVKNTGNVDYNDPIDFQLTTGSDDITFTKKTSLKPNQTIEFDLNKEVDYKGEYKLSSGGIPITGNVVLEGSGNRKLDKGLLWVVLLFISIFLIYLVSRKSVRYFRRRNRRIGAVREKGKNTILERKESKEEKTRQEDIDFLVKKVKQDTEATDNSKRQDSNMFGFLD